jgi:tetratricopeptide (TPR) repeat protein
LKEKLKKTIVKIVRKSFNMKKMKSFKGVHKNDLDHFYSTLYSHLVSQVHKCLEEMITTRRDELHEDVVVSHELANDEIDKMITKGTNDSVEQKYARLATEYEE